MERCLKRHIATFFSVHLLGFQWQLGSCVLPWVTITVLQHFQQKYQPTLIIYVRLGIKLHSLDKCTLLHMINFTDLKNALQRTSSLKTLSEFLIDTVKPSVTRTIYVRFKLQGSVTGPYKSISIKK